MLIFYFYVVQKDLFMHVFVHGFFGKEAIETITENDVIELAIDDAILNSVFKESMFNYLLAAKESMKKGLTVR